MAFVQTLTEALATPEDDRLAFSKSYSGGQDIAIDDTLGAGADQLVSISFLVANLKLIYIYVSEDALLETNSSSSPTNTISLKAGVPYVWRASGYFTNLITADVTKFYFSPTANCTLQIRALVDPTP